MEMLIGKVVLITGASRGLGRALALEFARRGANLVINSRSNSAKELRQTRQEAEGLGANVLAVNADVSDRVDVERLAAEALARFGRVDVLINNASALGPTHMPYLTDYPIEQFEQVLRTNVVAPFMLIRALVGQMLTRGAGSIINVSSDAGVVGYPTWGAYGISKAALDQLTRTWAAELEGTGVRINSVDPGSMDTEMHRQAEPKEDPKQWARPDEVTPVFIYLASDESKEVSGRRLDSQGFAAQRPAEAYPRMDMSPAQLAENALQPVFRFSLPPELEANEPPEFRGLRRDQVRMMVLPRLKGNPCHTRFDALADFLRPGDLLVVNNSRTIPGLLRAHDQRGEPIEVRLAHRRSDRWWDALLLNGRTRTGRQGMLLDFGQDLSARVDARRPDLPFFWRLQFNRCCNDLLDHIYRLGEPVRYSYVKQALPIDLYQTVYASEPGSVEMPSAGRAFTWELLLGLKRRGVGFASILLHTGLSSTRDDNLDATHPNYDEEYHVTESTAQVVNETHRCGGRVIAVGTTVVRALETCASIDGTVRAGRGWTRLHVDASHSLRAVEGLITGLHEPQASHLDLLSAFVQPERLQATYLEAIERGYLWHEFGDMNLIA